MNFNKYHDTELEGRTFLVTGGAGFIGSNLVQYLLQYGAHKVRVLDNFSTGSLDNIKEFINDTSFELIEGDIRDADTCLKACKGIDYVTHQAALGSVPRSINDPKTTNDVNITGFLNMLIAARNQNVKQFVYAASSSTYGDHPGLPKVEESIGNPLSPYAVTKYVNELYADVFFRIYNFKTIGLRYFNVFGPKQNINGPYAAVIPIFIEKALNNEAPVINGDGLTSRDFTFVANAVQANIKALLCDRLLKNEIVNIAFGNRTTLNELWQEISSLGNLTIQPIYREERMGDVKHSLANIEKASKLFSYSPEFSAVDGLEITYKWYQAHKSNFEIVD